MSERKLHIDFDTLLKIVDASIKEFDAFSLINTLSEVARHFDYYLWVDSRDVVLAFYDASQRYKEPVHNIYVTIVLRTGIAIKVSVDREKNSNEISLVRVWVVPVE
jgi:hypothetical protein